MVTRLKSRTLSTDSIGNVRAGFTSNTLETRRKLRNIKRLNITERDLEQQFLIQGGLDYWTKLPLNPYSVFDDIKWSPDRISVDRIDSDGDYDRDNILLTTRMMNCARNTYPADKFSILVGYLMGKNGLEYDDGNFSIGKKNPYKKLLDTTNISVDYRLRADFGKVSNQTYLTPQDIVDVIDNQNGECHYFRIRLNLTLLYNNHPQYYPRNPIAPSIDRIDCDKPYTRDNIVVCLRFANTGRAACSYDVFSSYVSRTFDLSKIPKMRYPDNTLERFFI